jgi:hypothetical protein
VWEEKPALTNVTETICRTVSVATSIGSLESEESAVPFCGCPCVQQSMGHCGKSLPAVKEGLLEGDAGVDVPAIAAQ